MLVSSRALLTPLALLALAVPACLGKTQRQAAVPAKPTSTSSTEVVRSVVTADAVELETTDGFVRVSVPRADVFRLQLARQRDARGLPSFAVDAAALAERRPFEVDESETLLLLRGQNSMLRIEKRPLRIDLSNSAGNPISRDVLSMSWRGAEPRLELGLTAHERVFGLGDKVNGFDRRGRRFELWNTDAFGFKVDDDPLYKSIPFLLMLEQGRARGVFIDHPARAALDIGKTRADRAIYEPQAAEAFDVYVFARSDPKQVIEDFTALTGRTPLPPLWALGYHQSRYGYLSEADARGVVARMQQERIPLDAIWLDIDFQAGNAPFTVNEKAFPTFAGMVSDFRRAGVRTVAITDLHIKSYQRVPSVGYEPYDSGAAGDHFIRDAGGFFEGPVWPGASVFPEFTREQTRAWWGSLYRGFVEQGVAGFWNDMNEPALFVKSKTMPETLLHRMDDGSTAPHVSIHNAYGSLNAQATYEGVLELQPQQRPFILTRAAYAGVQKYAASWTGDNTADRAHLAVTIPQLLNLGVAGYPFNGADVGGFIGCPDAELFAEWMELGALQPFFRNHSKKDECRREPWLFGAAVTARARKAVERRYRLLPYLYTLFEESSRNGAPIMRPLWLEYPNDHAVQASDAAYLLGRELLVAPKLVAGAVDHTVVLPSGDWYDLETSQRVSGGPRQLRSRRDDSVHLFARAGAIIPERASVPSTTVAPTGPLVLHVWPGEDCSGSLYVDDGESFAYQGGAFRRLSFACERQTGSFSVSSSSSGTYAPWWKEVSVVLHDVVSPARSVSDAAGKPLPSNFDPAKRTLTILLREPATDFRLTASF